MPCESSRLRNGSFSVTPRLVSSSRCRIAPSGLPEKKSFSVGSMRPRYVCMSNSTREWSISVFRALPFDAEGAEWLDGRFLLVDSPHIGEPPPLRQTLAQFG